MMTMKRIKVPWAPACEREETALPRLGPAKTKFVGSTRETWMEAHTHTHKRSSREAQRKPANTHTNEAQRSTRETRMEDTHTN